MGEDKKLQTNNFIINFDISELGDFCDVFPVTEITESITEQLLFLTPQEAREKLMFDNIFSKVVHYTKPYRLEINDYHDDFYVNKETGEIILNIKVKDKDGLNSPKLIPYKKCWILVYLNHLSGDPDVEMCYDLADFCNCYNKYCSGEFNFSYFCTLDHNLEMIDWHTFWDRNSAEESKLIDEIREKILKKYKKAFIKTSNTEYTYIY